MKREASGKALLITISGLLVLTGCLFSPEPGEPEEDLYYSPADSAWKVVANLQLAYVNRDIEQYLECFRDDFEFHLLEQDWADYNGDGIIDTYWGLDKEEEFHEGLFGVVELIELTFTGNMQYPNPADPTGESLSLPRTFDLKVYETVSGPSGPRGFRASGSAEFICRVDSTTGEWYIWQWNDQSEI